MYSLIIEEYKSHFSTLEVYNKLKVIPNFGRFRSTDVLKTLVDVK